MWKTDVADSDERGAEDRNQADATFFPNLDYLNFLQEGWRHTLVDGKLDYQGVVLNEMKGAFADPFRAVYSGISGELLKGTTYEVESGGDPLAIPNLSHQMLKDFHAKHYHPSQAVFMTAGPLAAADIQRHIALRVLDALPGKAARGEPQLARISAPREVTIAMPAPAACEDAWGTQLAWMLGESSDTTVYYHANLLDAGLLGDATSLLRKAMESAGYGRPSQMNGMDPSARQLLFHVGMDGLREEQLEPARKLLWEALAHAEAHGVPSATLQAALRDITDRQRDTSGQQYRSGVLTCTQAQIKQAVELWFKQGQASRAAYIGNPAQALAGLEMVSLQVLSEEASMQA